MFFFQLLSNVFHRQKYSDFDSLTGVATSVSWLSMFLIGVLFQPVHKNLFIA